MPRKGKWHRLLFTIRTSTSLHTSTSSHPSTCELCSWNDCHDASSTSACLPITAPPSLPLPSTDNRTHGMLGTHGMPGTHGNCGKPQASTRNAPPRYQIWACGCDLFPMKMDTTWGFLPLGLSPARGSFLLHFGIPDGRAYTHFPYLQPCLPASVSYNVAHIHRILLCMPVVPTARGILVAFGRGGGGGSRGPTKLPWFSCAPSSYSCLALAFHLSRTHRGSPASPNLAAAQGGGREEATGMQSTDVLVVATAARPPPPPTN